MYVKKSMLLHCILYLIIGRNLTYEIPAPAGNQVCGVVVVVVVDVNGYVGGVGCGGVRACNNISMQASTRQCHFYHLSGLSACFATTGACVCVCVCDFVSDLVAKLLFAEHSISDTDKFIM